MEIEIRLPGEKHAIQHEFIYCQAKRIMIRAGRRGGKTTGAAYRAIEEFLGGKRVLYAAPTAEQVLTFWETVKRILDELIRKKILYKNETERYIERTGTKERIKAKTAWNADSLRGDYADVLILDEFQLMCEDTWDSVGAPMLLDNDGDAIFIYTPPSLHSRSASKANDKRHASKLFKLFQENEKLEPQRYRTFHFSSHENPFISQEAVKKMREEMTDLAYRAEILAEDIDDDPRALWNREIIEKARVRNAPPLKRTVVAIDPSVTSTGNEAGIIVAGVCKNNEGYVLADKTLRGSPLTWSNVGVSLVHQYNANGIIAEKNNGGELVREVLRQVDRNIRIILVNAIRDKETRAEPVVALYEQGRVHHVGSFNALEDEMCHWVPGDPSPNRMDALVWAMTDLILKPTTDWVKFVGDGPAMVPIGPCGMGIFSLR